MKDFSACLAEFLGTFFLCFAGIATILCTQAPINSGAGLVGIALAHGLALSVAVNCFGGVSGAHFNPAVTIAALVTKRKTFPQALSYIGSQLIGAWFAAAICGYVFPAEAVASAKLGIPLPSLAFMTTEKVLLVEFILTYLLVTAIFGTAIDERGKVVKIGGFGIGLTVAFDILAGGALTGASMNPARSFGPTLALAFGPNSQNEFATHWIYWVAPIAGAVAAALVYDNFIMEKKPKS